MNCDHVSMLLGFVSTIFYFWVLYFFYLFVLVVLKMKFFVVPPAWSDSNFLPFISLACSSFCVLRFWRSDLLYYTSIVIINLFIIFNFSIYWQHFCYFLFLCVGLQLNFSETDAIHWYQMNIVGLSLFCLNGTMWKNMDLCVAFATYFYLFCVPCSGSFLYRVHLCITCKK